MIRAAGALLWREIDPRNIEIALIHRINQHISAQHKENVHARIATQEPPAIPMRMPNHHQQNTHSTQSVERRVVAAPAKSGIARTRDAKCCLSGTHARTDLVKKAESGPMLARQWLPIHVALCCKKASANPRAGALAFSKAHYFNREPNGTSSRNPVSTGAPPSSEAASNIPFDSNPRIFLGARFATITIFRPINFSGS